LLYLKTRLKNLNKNQFNKKADDFNAGRMPMLLARATLRIC